MRVYRGVSHLPYQDADARIRFENVDQLIDCSFSEDAYVSTSAVKSVAESFTGQYGMLMEIEIPAGTPLFWAPAVKEGRRGQGGQPIQDENELLLPRGGEIHITERLEGGQAYNYPLSTVRGRWSPGT